MSVLQLKKANCRDCYKCIRSCPIKSIEVVDHQAQIIENDCVLCGSCVLACPQNAKEVRNDVGKVKELLAGELPVIASVAPSFIADFAVSGIGEFRESLQKLGFAGAEETAQGAYIVKSKYEKLVEHAYSSVIISSCCHTVLKLIQKYYPELIGNIAPVVTPMQAHAKLLKSQHACRVVFIGPCISKKDEAAGKDSAVDAVLTFEEVYDWLKEEGVSVGSDHELDDSRNISRFFPKAGGILETMEKSLAYRYITVDGMEDCMEALNELRQGKLEHCFIEMSACKGSCINGPSIRKHAQNRLQATLRVNQYADSPERRDFGVEATFETAKTFQDEYVDVVTPGEKAIQDIMYQMGKFSPEDELNCGTCGYNTCREKAIAVYYGKADVSMCLPYMKKRAESFSDKIIDASPNGILTVDKNLNVQQANSAACAIFNLGDPRDIVGSPVSRFMDEFDFTKAFATERKKAEQKLYLAEYEKYVEQTLVYDREDEIVICLLKDVTDRERQIDKMKKSRESAADIAGKVIDKQMRVVQEIASLLGETTAETKIALLKLKDTTLMEDEKP